LRRPERKAIEKSFELTVSGNATTNGQRKGVPKTLVGAATAKLWEPKCVDAENKQFIVRRNAEYEMERNVSAMIEQSSAGFVVDDLWVMYVI